MYYYLSSAPPSFLWSITILFLARSALSTPIQFCKHDQHRTIDLCVAISTYTNSSTSNTDFYITATTTRYDSSPNGWNALVLSDHMEGALMFIMYGDPSSNQLTTSIRTATGHREPTTDLNTMSAGPAIPEVRIVKSGFTSFSQFPPTGVDKGRRVPSHVGTVNLICYSCPVWEGSDIDPTSDSQPMIWAVNTQQDFIRDFSPDAHLDMHVQSTVIGNFWVNLASAQRETAREFPAISTSAMLVGATESPPPPSKPGTVKAAPPPTPPPQAQSSSAATSTITQQETSPPPPHPSQTPSFPTKSLTNWLWHLHGLLLSLAFLAFYPLGALLIRRTQHPHAFNLHWTTQAFASLLALLGIAIGVKQSHRIGFVHQYVGLTVAIGVMVQIALGAWGRGMVSKRERKEGTAGWSVGHVWLGRGLLGLGFVNLVLGVGLRGYGWFVVVGMGVVVGVEAAVLGWMLVVRRTGVTGEGMGTRRDAAEGEAGLIGEEDEGGEFVRLVGGEDEEEEEEERDGREFQCGAEGEDEAKRDRARRLARLDVV